MKRVYGRGVEQRYHGIGLREEQGDLGAAQNDCLGALCDQAGYDFPVGLARGRKQFAQAELVVNDAMDDLPIRAARCEDGQSMTGREPLAIEVLFHGEAGAEETHRGEARGFDDFRGRIRDVKKRDTDRGLDGRRHHVHGIGTKNYAIRTGGLQRTRRTGEELSRSVPIAAVLQTLDCVEIHAVQHQPRRMQSAQAFFDELVDMAVVRDGGLPAHTADESQELHEQERSPR